MVYKHLFSHLLLRAHIIRRQPDFIRPQ